MYELWNGSLLNAEDYFLHANDTADSIAKKPRSTVNEFGVSVGGPMRPDKLFFFAHYEGIRIALPLVSQTVAPTPAYQQYVLGQLAQGGTDPITGTALPAEPREIAFYQSMFKLYSNTDGTPIAVNSCPLDASGNLLPTTQTSGSLMDGSGCANQRQVSLTNSDSENLLVVKIDHTIDREQQRLVSLSAGHGIAGSIYRSNQCDVQFIFTAAATHTGCRVHAYLQLRIW
jgi:hypothetical protein